MEIKEKKKNQKGISLIAIVIFIIIVLVITIAIVFLLKNMFKTEDTYTAYNEVSVNNNSKTKDTYTAYNEVSVDNNSKNVSSEKIVTRYRDNANRTNPNGKIKMTVKDITNKDEEKIIKMIGISEADFKIYKEKFMEIDSRLSGYTKVSDSTIKTHAEENFALLENFILDSKDEITKFLLEKANSYNVTIKDTDKIIIYALSGLINKYYNYDKYNPSSSMAVFDADSTNGLSYSLYMNIENENLMILGNSQYFTVFFYGKISTTYELYSADALIEAYSENNDYFLGNVTGNLSDYSLLNGDFDITKIK